MVAVVAMVEWLWRQRRVEARGRVDWVDPSTRRNVGARRKNPAGKLFRRWRDGGGGGRPAAGVHGGERESLEEGVSSKTEKLSGMSFHIELL
ncbi:hypothetical protein Tco_0662922 [Tanacetum coccineum]